RLPWEFSEQVRAGSRFYLKPLLPAITSDGRFYLLSLTQSRTRLLQGTRTTLEEVPVDGLPISLPDVLNYDSPEPVSQFHSIYSKIPGPKNREASVFHGHGGEAAKLKNEFDLYCRAVDHLVSDALAEEEAPLVLAGVDVLAPHYKQVNRYPHLIDETVRDNPDLLGAEELRDRAWSLIEQIHQGRRTAALERFAEAHGTG